MTLTNTPPLEGKWPRYQREVKEAASLLSAYESTLAGDTLRAYHAVIAWRDGPRGPLPPEPEATRVKSAAAMLRAGTLRVG